MNTYSFSVAMITEYTKRSSTYMEEMSYQEALLYCEDEDYAEVLRNSCVLS